MVKRFDEKLFAYRDLKTGKWSLKIYPKIVKYVGILEKKLEGCLTWRGSLVLSDRYRAVEVEYYDLDGNYKTEFIIGFDAQIWQHEVNHLNGVVETIVSVDYKLQKNEIGRNEPCPCGSGKKYKHCCLLLM